MRTNDAGLVLGLEEEVARYVTVYVITRHYGGPEEGGWWWNRCGAVASVPLMTPGDPKEVEEVINFLKPRFQDEGNIYSVRGGVEYDIIPESEMNENEILCSGGYQ